VGPRVHLDGCGKSRLTGIRSPDRSARNESLYGLSYPDLEHLKTRNVLFSLPVRTVADCSSHVRIMYQIYSARFEVSFQFLFLFNNIRELQLLR
jgi:hypothetical protein